MCQNIDLQFIPFIVFYQVFHFFNLEFYYLLFFIALCFLLFRSFFPHVVSSLAYPYLLENKMLSGYC
jgi:hypothetical protein